MSLAVAMPITTTTTTTATTTARFTYNPYSATAVKQLCGASKLPVARGCWCVVFEAETPRFVQRFECVGTAALVTVKAVVNNVQWRATALRIGAALVMACDACDTALWDDFLRVVAMAAASFGMTSGGEKWVVRRGNYDAGVKQAVPFCIGRDAIRVMDGATGADVVVLSTRGRGGVYRTSSGHNGAAGVAERGVAVCGSASHPQLPLLREVVADAACGAVRLVGARVQWRCDTELGAAVPVMMSVQELPAAAALMVTAPVVCVRVNPVKQQHDF